MLGARDKSLIQLSNIVIYHSCYNNIIVMVTRTLYIYNMYNEGVNNAPSDMSDIWGTTLHNTQGPIYTLYE